jgi:uncharacterized repeat protein (TIGR01451 family)
VIDRPSRLLPRSLYVVFGSLALVAAMLSFGVAGAMAAGGSAEIGIEGTNGERHTSGSAAQYTINFSCSVLTGTSCGEEPVIRIPLELTSAKGETPEMSTWKYVATSGVAGLVAETFVEGEELVIKLNPEKLIPGESDTIQLSVTPPNGITPNGTTWSLLPSFETEEIETIPAPVAATAEATATSQLSVSKNTLDGGAIYVRGHQVIFNIVAQCSPGATTGKLFMTEGSLVDNLPEGLEFVSATPAPTEAVPSGPTGPTKISWAYENGAALPPGCGAGSTGATNYQVVANVPETGADDQHIENKVTFSGLPIDEELNETSAGVPLTLINEPPTPGELGTGFLTKSSQAPLCIEGAEALAERSDCYAGTYPGHWITPTAASPAFSPGSAEGRFEVSIRYPASRAYETALVDPLPCLTEAGGGTYSSLPVSAPFEPGAAPLCAAPAFHSTVVWVTAPSLAAATAEGWVPTALLTNGEEISLTKGANGNGGTYFSVPAVDVPKVAAIELPPNENLTDNQLRMAIFGYADTTLVGGDVLHNTATATAYPIGSRTPANTSADSARIFIEPNDVQLGIKKTFGGLSNGPGGLTQRSTMGLVGSLTVPAGKTLPGPVIFADLLPEGMTWSNPVTTASFTVTNGLAGPRTVTAIITHEANYLELGRELIRITLPKAPFEEEEKGGFFTIKPPSGLFVFEIPNETRTFNNSAEIFVAGIGRETRPVCGGGEGTAEATFQSTDELDLSGTGEREQNNCESEVKLEVKATGGPNFSLKKFVQGDLDTSRKAALGIGKAERGGTGVFSLIWTNNGSAPLENPVVYDILPYVGDTGVDEGQSANPRDSEFATSFVEVVTPVQAGVVVEYSISINPCRPQVNPAAGATCTEDWSTTVPAAPGTVKALRFKDPKTFLPTDAFEVGVKVALPNSDVNDVAWNSAAASAETTTHTALRPAEPPKVGIEAEAPLVTPTIETEISEESILPLRPLSDSVTVGGTTELNGTVSWKLLGPLAPVAGKCTGLAWGGAAVAVQGSFPITGDGTYSTGETTSLEAPGCYAYEATVEGPGFNPVTSVAGTTGELVLLHLATPELLTQVSAGSVLPETEVTDSIEITGSEKFEGTVFWKLFGPLPAVEGPEGSESCEGLEWAGARDFDDGAFPINEDGTGITPADEPTEEGCYSYEVKIEGAHIETFVSPVGKSTETLLVHPAKPTLDTHVSAASLLPGGSVADTVTIAGTEGFEGVLAWQLKGPVAPAAGGSCTGLDWSTANVVAEGELEVAEDGTLTTASSELPSEGCYGYGETLSGEHLAGPPSVFGAAGETVLVHQAAPNLATTASPGSGEPGAEASDLITVAGTSGFAGTVHWQLLGPVPASGNSCAAVDWSGAPVLAQGTLAVTADGQLKTPGTVLSAVGCYGYQDAIEGTHLAKVTTPVGGAGETVLIKAAPVAATTELTIVKRVDQSTVELGKPLHYEIEVHNKGKAPATDVVVTDTPGSPLAFVSAHPSAGTCGHAFALVCKLGTLKAGAKATVQVVAEPTAAGKVVNDASVTSPSDPASMGAHGVKAAADSRSLVPLRLKKTVTPTTVEAGGNLHYTLAITNPTAAAARGVKVCDRLPAGLRFVSSSIKAALRDGSYCWSVAGVKAHTTAKIAVVARVLEGAAGRLVNKATLGGAEVMPAKASAAVQVKALPVREGGVTG